MAVRDREPAHHLPPHPQAPDLRLLWVDDEPAVPESSRLSLEANGVDLTIALDGASGIAAAARQRYNVIILDLRLGEAWGLDALQDLRSAGVMAPVMILTAYPEFDSALQAGGLGVAAYHCKPLIGKDLLDAVRRTAESGPARQPAADLPHQGEIVTRVLSDLDQSSDYKLLVSRLAHALLDPTLTLFEFLALSTCLRMVREGVPLPLSPAASQLIASAAQLGWEDVDDLVRRVVTTIEGAGDRWRFLRLDPVATDLGAKAATLQHALQRLMGLTFRTLIRAIVLRRATVELAANGDDIRQVAYRIGYDRDTSFNRDFQRHLRMSPNEFRAFLTPIGQP